MLQIDELRDHLGHGLAADQLHGEEVNAPLFAHRIDGDDTRVIQRSRRADFLFLACNNEYIAAAPAGRTSIFQRAKMKT